MRRQSAVVYLPIFHVLLVPYSLWMLPLIPALGPNVCNAHIVNTDKDYSAITSLIYQCCRDINNISLKGVNAELSFVQHLLLLIWLRHPPSALSLCNYSVIDHLCDVH